MATPQDAAAIFDEYAETGVVPTDPPAPPPANNAASYPALTLVQVPPMIETIIAQDGEVYELRLKYHYPLGIQSGLLSAYNTVLGYMTRETELFEWVDDDPLPVVAADGTIPPLALPDGAHATGDGSDASTHASAIAIAQAQGPRSGPLDEKEQKQRLFLLRKIAEYAVPDCPLEVRRRMDTEMLETLAIRFFIRSQAAQEAARTGNRPTSPSSSPASSVSTAAIPTPGSGNSIPGS